MRNQRLQPGKLLNEQGHLDEAGYATSLVKEYNRSAICAGKLRIKEWDYYLIHNGEYGIAMTLADNSYMGLIGASFLDFKNGKQHTKNTMTIFPNGNTRMPASSVSGDVFCENNKARVSFLNDGHVRRLSLQMKNFVGDHDFHAEVELRELEIHESMVIATPFPDKKNAFYYNQKIVGMRARGRLKCNGRLYAFSDSDSYGILDWGRGVWTYNNTWYWGAGQGLVNGHRFGFNIGYGFGDTAAASENMLFYDGRAHKLEDIQFLMQDYMKPWVFTSSDHRFEMEFMPILDRASCTNAVLLLSDQHQVFGRFTGKAVLDDGSVIEIKNFLGFAEKVRNKW